MLVHLDYLAFYSKVLPSTFNTSAIDYPKAFHILPLSGAEKS
jgi:hypothetical protein